RRAACSWQRRCRLARTTRSRRARRTPEASSRPRSRCTTSVHGRAAVSISATRACASARSDRASIASRVRSRASLPVAVGVRREGPARAVAPGRGGCYPPGLGCMILLNPGPVNVSPRVTAALGRGDLCHREPECAALLERIRSRLLECFATCHGFTAVLITGSGTAAVEAAVTSVCSERGRLVVVCNGIYGERMVAMATAARIPVTRLDAAWTAPPDLDAVEAALRAPHAEPVAIVHHETPPGLINPVPETARRARALGKLVLVDAVSGLGGDPLHVAGVDLVVGTGGKCIQAFPGMAFVLVRNDVM